MREYRAELRHDASCPRSRFSSAYPDRRSTRTNWL